MRLAAATAAAIVAVGLVSAPNLADPAASRAEHVLAVQLRTVELASVSLATVSTGSATKTPQAHVSLPQIEGVVTAVVVGAGAVALVPLWYAAAPITLPVSVGIAVFLYTWLSAIGLTIKTDVPAPLAALGLGIAGWAIGPLYVVRETVKGISKYLNSVVAQQNPVASSASAPQAARQTQHTKSGLAGSRRTATPSTSADRKPATHRNAKTAPKASTEKQSGTARSARPARTGD